MNTQALQSYWAVWLALLAVLIAVVAILPRLLRQTSRFKLKRVVAEMKKARKAYRQIARRAVRAERRAERLSRRAEHVKPRVLQEAQDAVEDAKALHKILQDKVMVAENHVRRVIYDEFPPTAHERLRKKYLPRDIEDKRPFSF